MDNSLASPTCTDLTNCRRFTDILWSCLTTLFACTWLSMHPNVPFPHDTRNLPFKNLYGTRDFLKYKLPFFLISLIVPEWILSLAVQQWLATRPIMREGGIGWTRTHAFFVMMGGFYAYKPSDSPDYYDQACHPLSSDSMIWLVREQQYHLPSNEEIEDRNKSNWLAKVVVLTQTTWFVVQCAARVLKGLPLTELEIMTLAYTLVNFATSLAWWSKPRNVNWPIAIKMNNVAPIKQGDQTDHSFMYHLEGWEKTARTLLPGFDGGINVEGRKAVPIFYSGKRSKRTGDWAISNLVTMIAGIIFGGVHCLAWSFPFPSNTDKILWQYSSVVMILVPVLLCLSTVAILFKRKYDGEGNYHSSYFCAEALARPLLFISLFPGAFMYISARVLTMYLAFKTLDSLPESAFKTVPWTQLIPHV
ncbi:hypothetical protein CPB86DRAFT_717954 [Serendipita vermifera]|nr:hypothetical protein CPB86DRAFT_717954 [Serendipita vermifera]